MLIPFYGNICSSDWKPNTLNLDIHLFDKEALLDKSKRLFFVALLPPLEFQDRATEIKQYFADRYGSSHALKSPPHVTMQAPFEWAIDSVAVLEQCLQSFASKRQAIPVTLSGFAAFVPRVIYINVIRSPELLSLQKDLTTKMENGLGVVDDALKKRTFAPHLTVAFKDLTKENFRKAWPEFEKRELEFEFTANSLTLLIHESKRWHIHSEYPFSS